MQISPLTKVLVACLGLVLGLSVLIAKLPGSGEQTEETAALEARLGESKAAAADPALRHRKVMRLMVWDREFERLERIAAASRKEGAAEGEEYVDLYYFYEWTGTISTRNDDLYWQMHLDHLTAWKETHPDSITPRIALAGYWVRYAWKARGGGWANSVTEEGWKDFSERIARGQRELDEVPLESRHDPYYFVEGITLAMALGLSKEEALHRFEAGLKVDPYCYSLYSSIVNYFLPRWHGYQGEVGKVILEEAEKLGEDRDWALTRIVWSLYTFEKEGVFDGHGIDYPVVKEIYEKWTSHEHKDVETANYYCLYACIAGDREAAKRMFDRIGAEFDEYCWGSEENFRKWKKRYG